MSQNDLNEIVIKPIKELEGFEFLIPDYQRGYRRKQEQVEDLLNDIEDFLDKGNKNEIYCLQPLVVKSDEDREKELLNEIQAKKTQSLKDVQEVLNKKRLWRVVDGQQRLTTIYLILHFLGVKNFYLLDYKTRNQSTIFLKEHLDDNSNIYTENIDFYYMHCAYNVIQDWFKFKNNLKEDFKKTLLEKVNFIWYRISGDEIEIFKRLNIGKIPLTNAELIKALFLNNKNFKDNERLKDEIAFEWDNIESQLQNDEFWYFIHKDEDVKSAQPTRIDFIFEIICFNRGRNKYKNDMYATFRFYKDEIKLDVNNFKKERDKIKEVFQTLREWFNDVELFHYIGYLVAVDQSKNLISELIKYWKGKDRDGFIGMPEEEQSVRGRIYKIIKDQLNFEQPYDDDEKSTKGKCKPILLLHNIETIVRQNKYLNDSSKYKLPNFSKFPFHLYKKEKWDVEHIFPSSGENLEDEKSKERYLRANCDYFETDKSEEGIEICKEIKSYLGSNKKDEGGIHFNAIYQKIMNRYIAVFDNKDRNKIKNFTLLDASTNRGISNSIFLIKRDYVIKKEKGELKDEKNSPCIAFVPPCTKNVFTKFYTQKPSNLTSRDKTDATDYQADIEEKLDVYINYYKNNK